MTVERKNGRISDPGKDALQRKRGPRSAGATRPRTTRSEGARGTERRRNTETAGGAPKTGPSAFVLPLSRVWEWVPDLGEQRKRVSSPLRVLETEGWLRMMGTVTVGCVTARRKWRGEEEERPRLSSSAPLSCSSNRASTGGGGGGATTADAEGQAGTVRPAK